MVKVTVKATIFLEGLLPKGKGKVFPFTLKVEVMILFLKG
jgi:hypothetical protein